MKTWYEVYYTTFFDGSNTVCICKSLKEARAYKKKSVHKDSLHIDLWENINNPTIVKTIE